MYCPYVCVVPMRTIVHIRGVVSHIINTFIMPLEASEMHRLQDLANQLYYLRLSNHLRYLRAELFNVGEWTSHERDCAVHYRALAIRCPQDVIHDFVGCLAPHNNMAASRQAGLRQLAEEIWADFDERTSYNLVVG